MIILQQTRAALSSVDPLALDLPFAATKSLIAKVGPTPTLTRASAATFMGSDGLIQTATANTPRFDHDPVTRICRGLLLEDSRTNLLLQSARLSTQIVSVTAVTHTLSFYGTGTVTITGAHSAVVSGAAVYPYLNTFSFTPAAGSLTLSVTGTVEFANLEVGTSASSWIPTTTASAVRSADVCSILGTNFSQMWNATEGTLYASFYIYRSTQIGGIVSAGRAGTQAGRIEIGRVGTNRVTFNITDDAGLNTTYLVAGPQQFGKSKAALAYKRNDAAGTVNALTPFSSTTATLGTQNELVIGNFNTNNRPFSGAIDSIRVYRKRLPLAKLQALTA